MHFHARLVWAGTVVAHPLSVLAICSYNIPNFFLAGDSTTAKQSSGGGGWGNGFLSFLKSPASGVNYGHNGATTVSFVSGGDWTTVLGKVKSTALQGSEPFVTIQFGHNDQKAETNISLDQYQTNLETLAKQVRSAGGTPLLVTPLTRRTFSSDHSVQDSLKNERLRTIAAGVNSSTRVLDLNLASITYVDAIGNTAAQKYNLVSDDRTHLNDWGSVVFGRMLADLLLGHAPVVDGNSDEKAAKECFEQWLMPNQTFSGSIWGGEVA